MSIVSSSSDVYIFAREQIVAFLRNLIFSQQFQLIQLKADTTFRMKWLNDIR